VVCVLQDAIYPYLEEKMEAEQERRDNAELATLL
jgi:hypothetical protein